MSTPLQILQSVFGYDQFRGHQQAIIDTLLLGNNALVLMPTGGGKSLCYQLPALLLDGITVVVSPLIALMQDQVSALQQLGVAAACLNSNISAEEEQATFRQLRSGELKLLYMAPERLLTHQMMSRLSELKLALLAIDEAHCVSQWGHDFRPEYTRLNTLIDSFPDTPRIALTATAEAHTRNDIRTHLQLGNADEFISSFDRSNISYHIEERHNYKDALLKLINSRHKDEAGIVYCLSRRKTEELADWLQQQGMQALPYHAGLTSHERQVNQDTFIHNEGIIMVATIAFGMGIDKPNVRFVAHVDLPKSLEGYYQETGRAGRDGLPASAWMMWGLQDVLTFRRFISESQANDQIKRIEHAKLDAMVGLCETASCRRQLLLAYFDEQMAEPCGNCDRCLNPVETFDGTELSQKALSCVYRSGQMFGMTHIIDILLGKSTEKIDRFEHDKLTTWGIGTELNAKSWRRVLRQLITQGLLTANMERYGALQLTTKAKPVLRGIENVLLLTEPQRSTKASRNINRKKPPQIPSDFDQGLFDDLRALRLLLAKEQSIPPYQIFHYATLRYFASEKPCNEEALLEISGVGNHKLALYGDAFLAVIANHQEHY